VGPADVALSVAITLAFLVEQVTRGDPRLTDFVAAPILASTVAWRRWSPAGAAAVGLVSAFVLHDPDPLAQTLLTPVVAVLDFYMLGLRSERRRRAIDVVLLLVPVPSIWLTPGDSAPIALISVWLFFFLLPYLAGRAIRSQRVLSMALARAAAEAETAQRDAASQAVDAERTRIARDLHDVVAHHVSVMAIQAVAARRTAPSDPERARQALNAVAACGREALVEMRRMVGVLRRTDLELATAWEPGLDQVHALADRAREAGADVRVRIIGAPSELSPAQDLVAFRVLQEALTNVIKHAGTTRADVVVRYQPTSVEISVVDDGAGATRVVVHDADAHSGHGLLGMRERLALYGGTMSAAPRRRGGFEVHARIPRTPGPLR
jgi:signal transduction histidine kinase